MSEPRLVDSAAPEHAAAAALLRELPTPSTSAPSRLQAEWHAIEVAAAGRRRSPGLFKLVLAAVASAAAGSALTFTLMKPPRPPKAPQPLIAWRVEPGSAATFVAAEVRLDSGTLHGLPSARPARCRTPFGDAAWTQARFLLETTAEHLRLTVESGEVQWRDSRGTQQVVAGQSLELPPAVLELPALSEAAAHGSACTAQGCLEKLAAGSGLDAENALFELALASRELHPVEALRHLREYQRRFPSGLFAAEVRLTSVVMLARLGRRAEAAEEISRFRSEAPDDPLRPALERLARQLDDAR